ncbi:MAG TPA: hypothetical protein VFH53_10150 [Phycisphaerae bacterium]|nr:hypothetical protein [Phycisphaerae bacterium]
MAIDKGNKGAYDFDPAAEPATHLIEINPQRYVRINGTLHSQNRVEEELLSDDGNKVEKKISWNKESARVWVPRRVADALAIDSTCHNERVRGVPPIATVIETRTVEDARPAKVERKTPKE